MVANTFSFCFSCMPWSSHSCNDSKYSYITRNICNQCVDSFKTLFGASLEASSTIVTTIETRLIVYSMFHVTWTTYKFNRNQLGTVLAYVMSSVPWSNQRAHLVISEKLLSKEFHCRTKDHKLDGIKRLLNLQSYFPSIILVSMTDK